MTTEEYTKAFEDLLIFGVCIMTADGKHVPYLEYLKEEVENED